MKSKQWSAQDRALGMDRPITRRDVLHGMALAGGSLLAGGWGAARGADAPAQSNAAGGPDYPPAWTGLRGSADGTFENAHALRDGKAWSEVAEPGESYDLIVVGAGMSGLAAAYFYRARTSPQARILLLDNHDDFGGHARRNEFTLDGRTHLLNGGTLEIDSPRPYSRQADGLLRALGLDVPALLKKHPELDIFEGMGDRRGFFFDRETFGRDLLVSGAGRTPWYRRLQQAPISERARADVVRVEEGGVDYYAGKTSAEKKDILSRLSYQAYLRDVVRVDPQVLAMLDARTKGWWGVGIDAVSALDCWGLGISGFGGLKLAHGETGRMGPTPAGYAATGGSYRLHFPDGNATLARLLVRSLIPAVAPSGDVEALVSTRFDYRQLDRSDAPVRLRLRSTVVRAQNETGGAQGGVAVTYVRDGQAVRVRARHCVLACYNMIIPYLCPELPEAQKVALHSLVKTPLVYTSVALRSARPIRDTGAVTFEAPGCYHTSLYLNPPLQLGAYLPPTSAQAPTLLHMQRTPCQAGLPEKEQNRAGRRDLLATSFETFERKIREQLGRMFGAQGLDPATDITAIMVNRWPHGYAPEYNSLFEPELPLAQRPYVVGRAPLGRIAIANSDSGGAAYTDVAIDQGHRAVDELLGHGAG